MNVYGVVYKDKGKIYYFNGKNLKIPNNVTVIVETNKGLQFAKVVQKINESEVCGLKEELKEIVRISTKKDYEQYLKNYKDTEEALKNARRISKELGLDMHFIDGDFTFDRKQLVLNFYADERVDFRELAKSLAGIYKTRIELRQIGARDKAAGIGGVGVCGRMLCCASVLSHMETVSINMAKNQNLSLNPSKINGNCGRLLCCLSYEDEEYLRCGKDMPCIGEKREYQGELGQVVSVDILNRKYKILVHDEIEEVELEDDKRA